MAKIIGYSRITIAYACLLIGLAGLILPILPGWIFILIGLELLTRYQPANNWAPKIKDNYQEYIGKFQKWRQQPSQKIVNYIN